MKVLFAVSNEDISNKIIGKYSNMTNEVLTFKNVYYFGAIIKELRANNNYDRIVIDELLETVSGELEEKYLMSSLDEITDLCVTKEGKRIPIVFIAKQGRNAGDKLLSKLYNIGIYDALLGADRKYPAVCNLLLNPRTPEEAAKYYDIKVEAQSDMVGDNVQGAVPKSELKNILNYYKKLKDKSEYSATFDRIATQYTAIELEYIIQKLPQEVTDVLKVENQNYNQLLNGTFVEKMDQYVYPEPTGQAVAKPKVKKEVEPVQEVPVDIAQQVDNIVGKLEIEPTQNVTAQEEVSYDTNMVSFVGTSKNGVSFLVNTIGKIFSSIGVNTAILDMSDNKNAYYIATDNDENIRKIAALSTKKLESNIADGVKVDKNLTVYTSLPGNQIEIKNHANVIDTIKRNHTLILVDCSIDSPIEYFEASDKIFAVQSVDVLTIQPLTTLLEKLKEAGINLDSKINVILNKYVELKDVPKKVLVGGLSVYNNPQMTKKVKLFNKDKVKVFTVNFSKKLYQKYLENMVFCKYDIEGFPKESVDQIKMIVDDINLEK